MKIQEIEVKASNKSWGTSLGGSGVSGETEIIWKMVPDSEPWSEEEAKLLTIKVRNELHRLLLLEAAARGSKPPEGGTQALDEFEKVLNKMRDKSK